MLSGSSPFRRPPRRHGPRHDRPPRAAAEPSGSPVMPQLKTVPGRRVHLGIDPSTQDMISGLQPQPFRFHEPLHRRAAQGIQVHRPELPTRQPSAVSGLTQHSLPYQVDPK